VTGVSEILVLILLISCILILPRMLKPRPAANPAEKIARLPRKKRAAIVASVLYPVAVVLVVRPWEGQGLLLKAAVIGLVPVALAWAVYWVSAAPKK
jgi:hypothetical protein